MKFETLLPFNKGPAITMHPKTLEETPTTPHLSNTNSCNRSVFRYRPMAEERNA
jgi:hypothetical protein